MVLLVWVLFACFQIPGALAENQSGRILPPSLVPVLKDVRAAMDEKNWAAAIERIRSAQTGSHSGKDGTGRTAPCGHPMVCLALGNCHLFLKAYAHAESAYLTALDMDPGFMDARVNLAKVYTDSAQHAKAAQTFLGAYKLSDPRKPTFLYYAAVMTLMDRKTKAAVDLFETLFAAHPDQITRQWKENYANALMTAQLWQKAEPVVRELARTAKEKEKVRWQETLLQIYLTTGKMEKARDYATTLARKAPANARWWKALVHIHLSLENYDRALDNLIIYGFATPLSEEEKKLTADLCLQLQIPARAADMYENILTRPGHKRMDPKKDKPIIQRLVNAYRQMGRTDKALALLNRFDPTGCDHELLLVKGDLLYETKDFKAANQAYRAAAQSNCAKKGQAWLMAGYAAWQQNDIEASRNAFEKAARFKRHRKDALAAMAQLERTRQM